MGFFCLGCFVGFWVVGALFSNMPVFLPSPIGQLRRKQWPGIELYLCRACHLSNFYTTKQSDTQGSTDQAARAKESLAKSHVFSKEITDFSSKL